MPRNHPLEHTDQWPWQRVVPPGLEHSCRPADLQTYLAATALTRLAMQLTFGKVSPLGRFRFLDAECRPARLRFRQMDHAQSLNGISRALHHLEILQGGCPLAPSVAYLLHFHCCKSVFRRV